MLGIVKKILNFGSSWICKWAYIEFWLICKSKMATEMADTEIVSSLQTESFQSAEISHEQSTDQIRVFIVKCSYFHMYL